MSETLTALVVEDNETDFELIVHELHRSGFVARCQRVEREHEYREALRTRPDIILADYSTPSFSAPEALRLLKENGAEVPFIVLTGTATEETVVDCMRKGAADYLLKDRLVRLGPAVKRALEESELRRQQGMTEAALRKSNERFQHLVETTKVIPCELDLATRRFTYVGPQVVAMLGYLLEDWYQEGFWDAHVDLQDPRTLELLDNSATDHDFTCRILSNEGRSVHLHCVVRRMSSDSGAQILRGFMMDITELKAMEYALARHAEDLARSNAELQQFASVASHDLQEPLRMVSFYTQLLAKRYQGKLDADANEFIGYVLEGASRMSHLIRHLLEYSRVSARKPELAPTDCNEIFRLSVENLKMALAEAGANVTHDPLPQVVGDASQLVQLLQNLIANAVKYRAPGRTPEVHVSVEEKPGAWIFSIKDNGIGIEPQYYETIFVIFQQLHARNKYPGSGVGLATCRRIVERHRGKIWVESKPGEGSTFYFTIPRSHEYVE